MALVHLVAVEFGERIKILGVFFFFGRGLLLIGDFETLLLLESLIGTSGTIYDFGLFP